MTPIRPARANTPIERLPTLFSSSAIIGLIGASLALASPAHAQGLPTGGVVSSGGASISSTPSDMTINQTSQSTVINWDSFNIGQGNSVEFVQPNSSSVALNRVLGPDASSIFGKLSANGQLFLVNPNGVLFGSTAQVNVGGLVASTLNVTDADFMAGHYRFSGSSPAAVVNNGSIKADNGFVALLGASVANHGLVQANMGVVALAAGRAITLDVAGDGLLNVTVDQGAVNALVDNGGMLRANGGQVLMTAQAAGALLRTAVNNSGVIEAQTLNQRAGQILLLGDMQSGTVNVSGVLDASAPNGGNGGFIETSASSVRIVNSAGITTAAPSGTMGTWLIDPTDFIIGAGGNISGSDLSDALVETNVTIDTTASANDGLGGAGDIIVNDAIAWTASGDPTTLTLTALRNVDINAAITATNGNLAVCCGGDVNVNAPLTTTNGSILLNAGQDVNVFFAITTTDGNIALCAGRNIHIDAAMTLTRGSTIPGESLGLPVGLTLIAGSAGTGPGVANGTLIFAPLAPPTTVTVAPVTINYNPVSYAAATDYSTNFVLTEGAALTQRMLVFPNADKVFDGSNNALFSGFNGSGSAGFPAGLGLAAGPGATATFDSSAVGSGIGVTYEGYTLTGLNADQYALAGSCCVSSFRTTSSISAVAPPPPPPPPPVVTPPIVTPLDVFPPVSSPATIPLATGAVPVIALAVIGGGVQMPSIELAAAPAAEEKPVRRAGSPHGPNAFLPAKPPLPKPVVPVHPRKQARN